MNERLVPKFLRDDCVTLRSHANGKHVAFSKETIHGADFDREGLVALRDAINCYLDTNSFAALSDESAGIYAGKVMRYFGNEVIVTESGAGIARLRYPNDECKSPGRSFTVKIADLLPLTPPAPKIRPYTPVEAAAHLGRKFKPIGWSNAACLDAVDSKCVHSWSNRHFTFEELATFTWADDGSPCGTTPATRASDEAKA